MKAIVIRRYGSADVLLHSEVEQPVPRAHEVLVRVRAASINHGDLLVMSGTPRILRLAFGLRRPRQTIIGRDIAGTVAAVGAKVTGLAVGDEVFGEMNQRGFAEYVTAPAAHLAAIPAGVSFEQAAALPVAGTTALQAVRLGKVQSGQRVCVNGASGGVGTFTVQVARTLGAHVTGVCSTRNMELVSSLGAHQVIDYTREQPSGPFDVIIDLAGNHRLAAFRRMLTPRGVYVSSSGAGGPILGPLPRLLACVVLSPFVRHQLRPLAVSRNLDDLTRLGGLVAAGEVTPVIERTYPLSQAAEAIRGLAKEHARGKIVLTVG